MSAKFDFTGKKVLITGASKGIGYSIAESFLRADADVAICARGKEIFSLANQGIKRGVKLLPIQADVTKEEEIDRVFEEVEKKLNGLDILVNNVGGATTFGNLFSIDSKDWRYAFELNVLSMVHFSKKAIPFLEKSSFARIINISSLSGIEPGFYNPHYTAAKASTINFSKYLANVLASSNVLVNCICPGSVETDSWESSLEQISLERRESKESIRAELALVETKKIPLKRMGKGKDIAPFVLFLASESASWITGSCFHVNGGKMRGMS